MIKLRLGLVQIPKASGLTKVEVFSRSRSFSLIGLRLRPTKFYSKYSAFSFVLKVLFFKANQFLTKPCKNFDNHFFNHQWNWKQDLMHN